MMQDAFDKLNHRLEKAVFTGSPSPKMPEMPCKRCGGRLSVAPGDYYSGILSCDACREVASLDDLLEWDKQHRPEYERQLAEWDKDWSIKKP